MRLVAIFNVWNDFDWLDRSVENISRVVDGVIVIASTRSNYNEYSPIPDRWKEKVFVREPKFHIPMHSETDKRNYGIDIARKYGYTHFIIMDSDELYDRDEFKNAKDKFKDPHLNGLVCPLVVYFKEPTLQVSDITLVPHIHKLTPTIKCAFNRSYPFAWSGRQIRIDPTRSYDINTGVVYTEEITMHHFSHVRSDYEKKLRNSTARANIEKSPIREDYLNAKPGYYCKFYQQVLKEVPDKFGIGKI